MRTLIYCLFTVCFEINQKMMTSSKRTTHNGIVLFCVTSFTEMFIYAKASETWFFSVVKGFRANFDHKI